MSPGRLLSLCFSFAKIEQSGSDALVGDECFKLFDSL